MIKVVISLAALLFIPNALTKNCDALDQDTVCLAQAIYYEARGEPLKGKIAVAHVILNRTRHQNFPTTVCKVTNQQGQFNYKPIGSKYLKFYELASDIVSGKYDELNNQALYFHNKKVLPKWGKQKIAVIGNHVFYK